MKISFLILALTISLILVNSTYAAVEYTTKISTKDTTSAKTSKSIQNFTKIQEPIKKPASADTTKTIKPRQPIKRAAVNITKTNFSKVSKDARGSGDKIISKIPKTPVKRIKTKQHPTASIKDATKRIYTKIILPRECQEEVEEIEFDYAQIERADTEWPPYLDFNRADRLRSDCDVLARDEEIRQDIDNKLEELAEIENEVNSALETANDLFEGGTNALQCIREMEEESVFTLYPSAYSPYSYIGRAYSLGGFYDILVTDLINFYDAYNTAHRGRNYVSANLETLRNLVEGLETFCQNFKCMSSEQKRYYEDLLDAIHDELEYYAGETNRVIDDARDFAEHFKNYNRDWVGADISGENICETPASEPYLSIHDISTATRVNIPKSVSTQVSSGRVVPIKVGNKIGVLERGAKKSQ